MSPYVELQVQSHFSLLRGTSSCEELFATAANQDYPALGIADHGTVSGIVRAWEAAKTTGVRLIAGCRLELDCGTKLLVYPKDRPAWSRLTALLTVGKGRGGKGRCVLGWSDVAERCEGLIGILLPDQPDAATEAALVQMRELFGAGAHLALTLRRRPDDALRLHRLDQQARTARVRSVVTGDVLFHSRDRRMLQDVVTCIRHQCTIDELGDRRERHADRQMKTPEEMARRFAAFPDAIRASADIAAACTFDLGELSYQYPHEVVIRGRVQKEGEVIHVIADLIVDHSPLLRGIGGMAFPHRTGRGDAAVHGGPADPRGKGWEPVVRDSYWPPHADGCDPEDAVAGRARNFR